MEHPHAAAPPGVSASTQPLPCQAPSTMAHALHCRGGHTATHMLGPVGCALVYNSLRLKGVMVALPGTGRAANRHAP